MKSFGRAVVLGTLLLGGVVACSAADGTEEANDFEGTTQEPDADSLGSFKFSVDTTSPEPLTIEPVEEADESRSFGPRLTPQTTNGLDSENTVLTDVTVTGPGHWDATTSTLWADVVVSHRGTITESLNEPQLYLKTLDVSGSNPGVVQFTTNNNNATNVGAVMALSDIQNPNATAKCSGSVVRSTATHHLVISVTNPSTTKFNFTMDVRANKVATNASSVVPDCDEDGYNTEAEDAGKDCNDGNVSVVSTCTCSAGTTECTNSNSSCSQTTTGNSSCTGGCTCNLDGTGGTDVDVTCTNDCNVTCNNAHDGIGSIAEIFDIEACGVSCSGAGSDCNVACSNSQVLNQCAQDCTSDANCNLTCTNNQSRCEIATCNGGSDCDVACNGTNGVSALGVWAGFCGAQSCSGTGTTCDVTCGSGAVTGASFAQCGVDSCSNGATCNVTCKKNATTTSTYNRCTMTCDATSTCIMDCSALTTTAARNRCRDGLTCTGRTRVSAGTNKWKCQ